ncbi:hypothetical protein J2X02_002948 [Pseudoxanthomonas japonensis]|jgi:hypothetical protein|uniref:DUF2059 domain-containing protein n=1 Tax=Pseudoxanthomonas TaxID=83618 RepID=UPI0007811209|nr:MULTISPECIES: DUF2059 domain-containing protein [Pseudoxanthomonas]MBA3928526.1 DUF2059 domain-containing protein [Xanthomonas sp.]MBL8256063.1 DUF2059 domain-containing protein [Pseudoxanthomonas mexicana]MDR7070097.1 hypothetical protein [Pseudoxanthomonas japonensis]
MTRPPLNAFRLPACLLVLLTLAFAGPASAAEPTDADIDRLLTASRAESLLAGVVPQMEAVQQQEFDKHFAGREMTDEQKAEVARIQAKTQEIVRKALSWDEMRPVYLDVYKKTYTRDDVRAITKFYESPAGKRMLDKSPALMQNIMTAVQQKMVPMLEELQGEIRNIPVTPPPPVSPPQKRRRTR